MFSKIILLVFVFSLSAQASYQGAERIYGKGSVSLSGYRRLILELVDGGFYFSAIPWLKEYMVKNSSLDAELEEALDKIILAAGVKPFESLPEKILQRSKSGNIKYILAKRQFKKGQSNAALSTLSGINADHSSYPFIANLRGTILSDEKKFNEALSSFKDCVKSSASAIKDAESMTQKEQLEVNRDICVAGEARVMFAARQYKEAELRYLDISKDAFIWPEILFEEAWTSYYLKNYNRTLGKLVSYRAPVFDFIFKPEVEVLRALTFLKMCLFEDSKKTVDEFYSELLNPSRDLRNYILKTGKNYRHYYNIMAEHESSKTSADNLISSILKSIRKDAAFIELKGALSSAVAEYNELRKQPRTSMRSNILRNIKLVMEEYRTLIGAYVRAGMVGKYAELYSAFQGMSYIKLETLSLRKEKLYQSDTQTGQKRGDVRYIDRNDKQYFWNFNGEFWADELGDYVFALRSEC